MEIALYILSAIGSAAVLLFFYVAVRDVINHGEEIESIKHWNRRQGESIDKAHERQYALQHRVDELEEVVAGRIADVIETKTRRQK